MCEVHDVLAALARSYQFLLDTPEEVNEDFREGLQTAKTIVQMTEQGYACRNEVCEFGGKRETVEEKRAATQRESLLDPFSNSVQS